MVVSDRDTVLDVIKGIGILLVIWGHCCYSNRIVYLFHMPLFFFATGCLMSVKKQTAKKVISSIGYPYLFFSIFFFFYWLLVESRLRTDIPEFPIICDIDTMSYKIQVFLNIFCGFCKQGSFAQNEVLWFLPTLLSCELIILFLVKKFSSLLSWVVVISLVLFTISFRRFQIDLPLALDRALLVTPFMLFGFCFYNNYSMLRKTYIRKFIFLFVSILGFIAIVYLRDDMLFDIFSFNIYSWNWFYFVSLLGIACVFAMANFLSDSKGLIWLGQNSILLMIYHIPILKIVINISSILLNVPKSIIRESMCSYYGGTMMFIVVLICCIPFTYITSKYFSWTYRIKDLKKVWASLFN